MVTWYARSSARPGRGAPSRGGAGRAATPRSTGRCRNTLFREHARARRTPRVASAAAALVAMFRFVNKSLAVGSAEMATVDGVVVGQPVPLDAGVYRESHHLLALDGSMGMRGSVKHEAWGGRGSHLRMRMDFLDVS